jgi:hypothetical protein
MKGKIFAVGLAFLSLLWVGKLSAQSVIQTTDVTVVYSTSQSNTTFENVTKFYFSNGNLIIDQSGVETSIPTNTVRRLELAAITTPIDNISEWGEDAVFVYPNPTSDKLFFSCKENQEVTVSVFSMNGQLLQSEQMNTSESLNVSSLAKGMYIIRINNQNYKFSKF